MACESTACAISSSMSTFSTSKPFGHILHKTYADLHAHKATILWKFYKGQLGTTGDRYSNANVVQHLLKYAQ